eukprot:3072018-Pyramimonas_sp.AAC.1
MQLLEEGNKRRKTESTTANMASSRSHAVLEISVTQSGRNQASVNTSVDTRVRRCSSQRRDSIYRNLFHRGSNTVATRHICDTVVTLLSGHAAGTRAASAGKAGDGGPRRE